MVYAVLMAALGLFYYIHQADLLFYVSIISSLLMILSVLIVRLTKNFLVSGHFAIFIAWITVLVISWNTGAITFEGVMNPSWTLNAGLILLAIFLFDYPGGTLWSILVFVETGIIIHLFRTGYQFPNFIPPQLTPVYSLGAFLIGLLIILLLAFIFLKEKSEAVSREKAKTQALRESNEYIDTILSGSPIPTFIVDRSHRVIQWNPACQRITGIQSEDILGKRVCEEFMVDGDGSMADMILEDPASMEEKYSDAIVSKTESGRYEMDIYFPGLKGGTRALITVAPIKDNFGNVRGAIQTLQVANTGQSGSGRLDDILAGQSEETFAYPLFRVDTEGNICFWNKACEKEFGHPSSKMIGRSAQRLIAKRYRPIFTEAMRKLFSGEPAVDKHLKYITKDGHAIYVISRLFSIEAADGKSLECVVVNTNITGLRIRLKKVEQIALENKEKYKVASEECSMLKRNIATFMKKRGGTE
jgi:PAS domain S-box-containing protein